MKSINSIKWTAERDLILIKGSEAGLSASDLAEQMGVTRNTICGRKYRLGILGGSPSGGGTNLYADEEIATLREMRAAGKPFIEIADCLGRSEGALGVKAHRMGIARPRKAVLCSTREAIDA
jgi:hypothetical protein